MQDIKDNEGLQAALDVAEGEDAEELRNADQIFDQDFRLINSPSTYRPTLGFSVWMQWLGLRVCCLRLVVSPAAW